MEELATREMENMWSNLPTDILERVFTFLPIASVCQFRMLSKSWNRYITSPNFTHAQASNVSPEEYVLIASPQSWYKNWCVLDVARRRFLNFSDEFLRNHVQQGLAPLIRSHNFECSDVHKVAPAGGLFCMKYLCSKTCVSAHFVCNPVLKTVKQLPYLAWWSEYDHVTVMSTDRVSMEYEIFVVNIPYRHYKVGHALFEPHSIFVYESKTGSWRSALYKPLNPSVNYSSYQVRWDTLTIFRNQQYCVVNKGSCGGIVSYDKETGEVSDLAGIDIPLAPTSHLIVNKDKLFCVIRVGDDTYDFSSVEIFEINIIKKESILLTEMPHDLLIWVLDHDDLHRQLSWSTMQSKIRVVTAQSADSILIYTDVGRCAVYSLSKKSWYQYPDNRNVLEAHYQANVPLVQNCLSLCPP